MIGTARRLGNRFALCAIALALSGCANVFFAAVDKLEYTRNVIERDHIVFDATHGLALDAYAPAGANGDPVVVFFYGGSWSEGKRHWYRYVGDALANQGVVVFIPDYRKYPDVRFPAFMHDAANAVRWARDHAAAFGGDPAHVFVMGHSAGGQIAALLACDKRYLNAVGMQPRELAGMIGVAGAYAFLPFVEDEPEIFGNDANGRYDSQPINFVDGDEPPMLLLQGTDDDEVPPSNAEAMAERARAMDGTATLKLYPDVGHSSILLALARGRETPVPTLADTLAFIQRIDAASHATSVR
ncbi:MAG: alpha/beta hydrolase [Xanthomonadaceae bacterium]|nr:alpha/beta hydrolase [Xanthomonadaceae bacterium]